jgi:hypothetical protein
VSVGGELIRVAGRDEEGRVLMTERGLETFQDSEGELADARPAAASDHALGANAIDQRAFAPAIWRTAVLDGQPRDAGFRRPARRSGRLRAQRIALGLRASTSCAAMRRRTTAYGPVPSGSTRPGSSRASTPGETFTLQCSDSRWLGIGSTVRITNGLTTELRLVMRRAQSGVVYLDRALEYEYLPWQAEVSVQVRRPVNVNTATAETLVALFENVGLDGQNSRIDRA